MNYLIISIVSLIIVAAVVYMLMRKPLKENFWGLPGRTVKKDKEYKTDKYNAPMYSVPPSYQGMIEPRFSNVDYGANILYNIPDKEHLASPDFPLTFQGNVKEQYSKPPETSDEQNLQTFAAEAQNGVFEVDSQLPAANSEDISVMNAGDHMAQILNYDRLIFANQKSRLYGLGDPIRGDLPIVPVNDGWFRPSVHANIDLRQGAINVIAGHDNSTSNALRALQADYSGKTALAQKDVSLGAAQGDIIVTAFP